MTHCSNSFNQHLYYYYNRTTTLDYDRRMDTFSSVDYDQRSQMHHHHDYGVETSDTALFDNIINSYEKSDHELDGKLLTVYRIYLVDLMEGFFRRQKNIFS